MKKTIAGIYFFFILFAMTGIAFALPVSDDDLWEGANIGIHSPELGSSNGSSIQGFFDGKIAPYGSEEGNAIFASGSVNSIHTIEWSTTNEVSIKSINFVTYHDFDQYDIRNRGIRSFSLSYKDGSNNWIKFYESGFLDSDSDLHYGGGSSYQFDPDPNYMTQSYLELTANLNTAITAQSFRGEFVQYGASGSRIVELDAYNTLQPVPEPATMILLGSGLIGLTGFRKRLCNRRK